MSDIIVLPAPVTTQAPLPTDPRFLRGIARLAWRRLVETRPDLAAQADGEQWIGAATEVLARNLASGRFAIALPYLAQDAGDNAHLLGYAGQVLEELLAESDRLAWLKAGDTAAWSSVLDRLEKLAFYWLGPAGRADWAAWEAREAAAHTCADLWLWLQKNPYPFDVPFDRWSARALTNRLLEARRKREARERWMGQSVDHASFGGLATDTAGDSLADWTFDAWLEQAANREALLQALGQLDERVALVLRLWYLEQWPADEIAAQIGTRVDNVYVLRFRGLERLRKVAMENERFGLGHALHILEHEGYRTRPAGERQGKENPPS